MPIDITYLGHSGFVLRDGRHTLVVDPFLTGNPLAVHKPTDIKADFIALTHGHADHVGDTAAIVHANDATLIAPFEVTELLGKKGVKKCEPGNPGGRIVTPFGWIAFTQAFHSSSYEGQYAGNPCGLVIHLGGVTLYHTGDTALFSDMKLIGEIYRPQVAMIPIGDRFTMGPDLAARAAEMIQPRVAIPVHYNTWPAIAQDPAKFQPRGVEVKAMKPGQTWRFGTTA